MSFLKNLISGFVGNYGDDIARSAANQADDALRIAASQADDLGRIVSRGKNALMTNGDMPETQQMLKNLLSENVADQIYPRVDDDYFNMFTNQKFRDPYKTPEDLAKVATFKNIIESGGEITPITVRVAKDGRYAIDDGMHRMQAFYETGRQPLFKVFDNKDDSYNFADLWDKANGKKF